MSTLDDLDAAVRANLAEEHPGQLVTGWALVVSTTDADDAYSNYDTVTPESQPAHHTVGLFAIGQDLVINQKE